MESVEQYLLRKHEELKLLNSVIARPIIDRRPRSVEEVIEQKFHLAAALKAEHELHDWAFTETAWTHARRPKSGPFTFTYDYQRADLQVQGPSFYAFEDLEDAEVIYTASGMAAISALLMALAKTWPGADLITLPNAYGETSELVDGYVRSLNRVELTESFEEIVSVPAGSRPRILSLDSSTSSHLFEALLRCERPRVDLIVFDTTCFSGGSGRIRRVFGPVEPRPQSFFCAVIPNSIHSGSSMGVWALSSFRAAMAAPQRRCWKPYSQRPRTLFAYSVERRSRRIFHLSSESPLIAY